MPIDLSKIVTSHKRQPPRILVYGPHGVGKTTFACSAVRPIVIRTEDGLGTLDVPAFEIAKDFGDVLEAIEALSVNDHKFRTVILDSVDWLEPLAWADVCRDQGVTNIEQVEKGYGKGYVFADAKWKLVLDGLNDLRNRGMTVILIAHAEVKRAEAPDTEPYDRWQPKLHKRASALVQEWADMIGFAHHETIVQKTDTGFNKKINRGKGTGSRLLSLHEQPAYLAKTRYPMPESVALEWPVFADHLRAAFAPASPATNGTTPSTDPSTQPTVTEELIHG
jgi:hypothetical protein